MRFMKLRLKSVRSATEHQCAFVVFKSPNVLQNNFFVDSSISLTVASLIYSALYITEIKFTTELLGFCEDKKKFV